MSSVQDSMGVPSPASTRPTQPTKQQRTTADYSLSCAECRRLKLKCSRQQWPCETCIKRGIPHLCPDGIQKRERSGGQSAVPSSKSSLNSAGSSTGAGTAAGATDVSLVWSRLDGLERKLDLLLEASSAAGKRALDANGSLHDLASIATDHYALEKSGGARGTEDATRPQHGTLTLHPDGRAHYMGSNAHSMYLTRENPDNRRVSFRKEYLSRPGSPTPVDLEAAAGKEGEMMQGSPGPDGTTPSTIESQPTQLVWATPGFRSPHSSTAIWDYLKATMPARETAQRMMDVYYSTVTFMFHPIPRHEFDQTVWSTFYPHSTNPTSAPPADFHPHKMALLSSMLSLGVLLDVQRPQRDPVGRALYSCAWSALALSNFTEATSLEAILALMHINMYLTWRRGGRYAESAYPLLGTMMRMTISTGLHRDPSLFHLGSEERERRRRAFWDVQCSEVFRAFAFCRPPALCDRHVDTRYPVEWRLEEEEGEGIASTMPRSPARREGIFHAFKCKQVQITNRMLDECLCANSTYQDTMRFDQKLRQVLQSTPGWMLPTLVDLSAKTESPNEDLERAYSDEPFRNEMILEMQRHTTLLNHYQALLLLHRAWFSQALQLEEEMQSGQSEGDTPVDAQRVSEQEEKLAISIDAVNESASNIIAITISAWSKYPALVIRWAFFWNAIFSAAVCRGLFVVKCPTRMLDCQRAWRELKQAIELLEHAVVGWAPLESPLGILSRLNKRAETAINGQLEGARDGSGGGADEDGEDMELIGDERRKIKRKASWPSSLPSSSQHQKKSKVREAKTDVVGPHPSADPAAVMPTTGLDATLVVPEPLFDTSAQQLANFMPFGLQQQPSMHPFTAPSVFASSNAVTMDSNGLPSSTSASASQLIQMLSSGLSWDDVSSWNDLIVDL